MCSVHKEQNKHDVGTEERKKNVIFNREINNVQYYSSIQKHAFSCKK